MFSSCKNFDLFNQYKKEGRILHEDYEKYDGTQCVHRPEKISPEDLTKMYWWLYNKVFSINCILRRTIFKKYAFKHPLVSVFALVVNLHYRKYIKGGNVPNIF